MDISLDQPSPIKRFWRTWRREIIRGGVLFSLVVGAGLFIGNLKRNINIPSPLGALGAFGDFNWGDGEGSDLFGHGRKQGDPWEYRAFIRPSQQVWIKNTNGPIDVVAGESESLFVHAEKSWRNSNPASVRLVPILTDRGVTICAMWAAREARCEDGGEYRLNGVKKNDVAVRIMVELPRSVPVEVSTVNGGVHINGVDAPVEATTVNGGIGIHTSSGPVKATTINGNIDANMRSLGEGDIRLTTVNGSLNAGLPASVNANIDAETVNGRVETEFPVKISGKVSTRHLRGVIGSGGPTLKLVTVNGSISLHEAGPEVQMDHPMAAQRRAIEAARAAARAAAQVTVCAQVGDRTERCQTRVRQAPVAPRATPQPSQPPQPRP